MKYEAKYSKTGNKADDAGTGIPPDGCRYNALYDTWDWGNTSSPCPSSWPNTNVVSSAYGSPIAGVTHDQAKAICLSLGGHLLTNQEWMTIARNAEQVASNWSGGSVGSGCLFRGNNGTADSCGYNGSDPEKGVNRNAKAKLILSNGSEIWDLAGNVWEHALKDAADTLIPQNQQPTLSTVADDAVGDGGWGEFSEISGFGPYFTASDIYGSYSSSSFGVGKIWTYGDNETAVTSRVLLRGGDWNYGDGAGAFALNLNWAAADQGGYAVGFRCVR